MENEQQEQRNENSNQGVDPGRGFSRYINNPRRRKNRGAGLAKSTGKKVAKEGYKKAVGFLAANWEIVAIAIAFVAFVGIFLWILFSIKAACDNFWDDPVGNAFLAGVGNTTGICNIIYDLETPENAPGVTIEKEGPSAIANGEILEYIIKVTYDPSAFNATPLDELYLYDVPLFENKHESATEPFTRQNDSDGDAYYTWKLSEFTDETSPSSPITIVFKLAVAPGVDDYIAVNAAYAATEYEKVNITYLEDVTADGPITSSGQGVKPCGSRDKSDIWYGADCLPTKNYCANNKYKPTIDKTITWITTGIDPDDPKKRKQHSGEATAGDGGNFGDPLCSYKLAKAEVIIDELEPNPSRASFWKDITSCEGGVNSYGRQVHDDTGRPNGPAGMFQMNIGKPIFSSWKPGGSTLRGDVPWQRQIQNAIANNNEDRKQKNDFGFYGSAMCLCWWPEYRKMDYCKDIVAKGINNLTGPRAPSTNCPKGPGYLPCETRVKCTNIHCNSLGRQGPGN